MTPSSPRRAAGAPPRTRPPPHPRLRSQSGEHLPDRGEQGPRACCQAAPGPQAHEGLTGIPTSDRPAKPCLAPGEVAGTCWAGRAPPAVPLHGIPLGLSRPPPARCLSARVPCQDDGFSGTWQPDTPGVPNSLPRGWVGSRWLRLGQEALGFWLQWSKASRSGVAGGRTGRQVCCQGKAGGPQRAPGQRCCQPHGRQSARVGELQFRGLWGSSTLPG